MSYRDTHAVNMTALLRTALFGDSCCVCHAAGSAFCIDCAPFVHDRHDEYVSEAALPLRALGHYDGNLRAAVLKLKDGRRDVAEALAVHLALRVSDLAWVRGAVLVPMPTAAHRIRLRGLDGAALLAHVMARTLELGRLKVLRSRSWRPQQGRSRRARLGAAGRFEVQRARDLKRLNLVLVDDVVTTGATLREAAAVLRQAGATVCGALVIARTLIDERSST